MAELFSLIIFKFYIYLGAWDSSLSTGREPPDSRYLTFPQLHFTASYGGTNFTWRKTHNIHVLSLLLYLYYKWKLGSVKSLSHIWLCNPMDCSWPGSCPWNSPGKNTGVGSHSLLKGIFPTQGLNLGLLHCTPIIYHLSHKLSPVRKHFFISVIADKQSKKSRTHSLTMAEIPFKVE